jgi:phosphate uptake regulator
MSIVKDAKCLGDYAKNLFDLAKLAPCAPEGEHRENFSQLRNEVLAPLKGCSSAFDALDQDTATRVIVSAKDIEDRCDEFVSNLVRAPAGDAMAPSWVLTYRYDERIASHSPNIASSVVQPLHKLDFTSSIAAKTTSHGVAVRERDTNCPAVWLSATLVFKLWTNVRKKTWRGPSGAHGTVLSEQRRERIRLNGVST